MSTAAPLTPVILGSLLVYFTQAENHGVQVIGYLKNGLNPPCVTKLMFLAPHIMVTLKAGIIPGIIALAMCKKADVEGRIESQLKLVIRPMYSYPLIHGASTVATILKDKILFIVRPRMMVLGNISNSAIYRRMDQYKIALHA